MIIENTKYFFKNSHCFVNGIWSGIPLCCVKYYIDWGIENPGVPHYLALHRKKYNLPNSFSIDDLMVWPHTEEDIDALLDYTQCKECSDSNNIVELKQNGVIYLNPLRWPAVLKNKLKFGHNGPFIQIDGETYDINDVYFDKDTDCWKLNRDL